MPRKIIIDTDVATGRFLRDVDDGIAITSALFDENVEVVGITTVYGNTSLRDATMRARKIVKMLDADIPIYPGASAPGTELTPAAKFIIKSVLDHDDIAIVGIGPHTNIATAIAWEPEVENRTIVLMGGALVKGNVPLSPRAEFNVFSDPLSTDMILARGKDVWMVGLDVTMKAIMTRRDIEFLARYIKGEYGIWFLKALNKWYNVMRYIPGMKGFPLHDPLALATLTVPESLKFTQLGLAVITGWINRGALIKVDRRPVNYATRVDTKKFKDHLLLTLKKAMEYVP